jgi:esterase/lipase superfamily enzyme
MSGYLTWFACQHVPAIIDGGRWRVTPRVPIVRVCISFLNALVLVPALVCSSCGGRPPQGALIPVTATAEGTSRVPILIATTRQRSTADTGEMFSGERAAEMSYAAITVSIPPDAARKIGEVQWPVTLPGDPGTNFVTVSAEYIDKQRFAASIAATAKRTGRTKVLVFVHGFNNRFDEAVYRFAQIVHDSKVPAIPVLFTWPSRGEVRLRTYNYDRESASYSRDALESLLGTLTGYPAITEVNLLAHSMGNWVALEALRGRSIRGGQTSASIRADKLKNAMLVAPDVDVDVFRAQIQRMGAARPRIALFVSQDDSALRLSRTIADDAPRLGNIDPTQEPYRSELERDKILVFDLTHLATAGDDAHGRAFDDVTSVMGMIRRRLSEGQALSDQGTDLGDQLENVSTLAK